jgi:hypothetical protein
MQTGFPRFLVVSFIFAMWACPAAKSDTGVQGGVNMQGSIIDTACAIAVDSRDQTIAMGVVPLADIIRDGQGHTQPFSIKLINCVVKRPNTMGNRRGPRGHSWWRSENTFDVALDYVKTTDRCELHDGQGHHPVLCEALDF